MSPVSSDPTFRWGTPFIAGTDITVARVVALHAAGELADLCPELTPADVADALAFFDAEGPAGLRPRPPAPGDRHPRVTVDPDIQGGFPVISGTRVTVDAVAGLWEAGATLDEIMEDYPGLTMEDVLGALAYDREARLW